MKLRRVRVQNFKTFDDLDLELGDFNVFVGANASGKTNFIHILKFLRDIAVSGLENAVSLQGDVEFLRNINIGAETPSEFEFLFDRAFYVFSLKHFKKKKGYKVIRDMCQGPGGVDLVMVKNRRGTVEVEIYDEDHNLVEYDLDRPLLEDRKVSPGELLLSSGLFGYPFQGASRDIEAISIYNFDPRLTKSATSISGKADLEEDGSNLALVLKKILEDEHERRNLLGLLSDVLPFVRNVSIDKFLGPSLMIKFQEQYSDQSIAASLISDGTVMVVGIIIALYFEDNPIIAFEEPENNIHPHLISKVIGMMKEQAANKQIFVTTHSPEVVKHAGLENLYLVSRDKNGFSRVSRPKDSEEVKIFLEHEMGLDDLFVQNLLEL